MFTIKRFGDYSIFESKIDVGMYVTRKIDQIEIKLKKLFNSDRIDGGQIIKGQKKTQENGPLDFFKNLNFESLEKSKFSKLQKSIKLIYSDDEYRYDVTFSINLKDIMPTDEQEFDQDTITDCKVEFKRYDLDENSSPLGSLDKTIKIEDIDGELFQQLLLELDEQFPSTDDDTEFSIETE